MGGGDGGGGWYPSVHYALWQAQLQDLIKIALCHTNFFAGKHNEYIRFEWKDKYVVLLFTKKHCF